MRKITYIMVLTFFILLSFQYIYSSITILNHTPLSNALNVTPSLNITLQFSASINTATLTGNNIRLYGSQSGIHNSILTYNSSNNTVTIDPNADFRYGETIEIIVTQNVKSTTNDSLAKPYIWRFNTDVTLGATGYVLNTSISGAVIFGSILFDCDNDGDLDAAAGDHEAGTVIIYKNNGNGDFSVFTTLTGGGLAYTTYAPKSADFNCDGNIDLAVPVRFSNIITIWFGNGSGNFSPVQQVGVNAEPQEVSIADLNGDGYLDVVAVCNNAGTFFYDILINDKTGHFNRTQQVNVPARPDFCTNGDVDNDGDIDIFVAVAGSSASNCYILNNSGSGSFTVNQIQVANTGATPTPGDFDGDGDLDLIVNGNSTSPTFGMKVLKNNGTGTFSETQIFGTQSLVYGYGLKFTKDINNDGYLDFVTSFNGAIEIYTNNGSGNFSLYLTIAGNGWPAYSMGIGDITGNGSMGICTPGNEPWVLNIYKAVTPPPPPPAPLLVSPGNGSSCITLTTLLDWSDVTAATSYNVQVATDAAFTTPIINITGLTSSQYAIPSGLANNTLYYWRAASVNSGGTTWSSAWSFTSSTVNLAAAPTLLTPANGVIGQTLTPTLDWSDLLGAASYKTEISTNNSFTTITDSATVSVSQYTILPGKLSLGTLYYWRVTGRNACNISPISAIWNFTTAANPPAIPTLVSPANGAGCQSLNLTLDWSDISGATSYTVQVSFVSTFATTVINESNLTSSQYIVPSNLTNNSLYYWRVNAANSGGTSAWSEVWSFTTTSASLPVPPVLSTPLNGATGQSLTPKLVWLKLNGASIYRVQISTGNLFTTITDSSTVTDSFYTIPSGKLANDVVYYWRVFGINSCNISTASLVWNFKTDLVGIIHNSEIIPKEFNLYNNFPNPFNPVTSIPFDIPVKSFVTLKIWDLLGKEIMTLVNSDLSPGKYEFILNASGLSSGMYIYKLKANNYTSIKKMVLIK